VARTATPIHVARQAGACGAIVTGVDVASVDDDTFEELHDAFLEHHVLAFRDQVLTPEQQLAFASRWGEVFVHPYVPSIEGHPGIMEIYQMVDITETWHADVTFAERPPKITMLYARIIPEVGGDTMFASQHRAYEELSSGMQSMLQTLRAVHYGTERARDANLEPQQVTCAQPVVITHPETGRRALYVNGNYTRHFENMTERESRPLLEFLYAHASQPEYTYRHRWQVGDLVMWDNRSVQHRGVHDHGSAERRMHRVTIQGDRLS
jgi:taurine dioxygenase